MCCLLPVVKRSAQNFADLWFACVQFLPLYLLSRCDVALVTSHTRPSRFLTRNIESWEWPGDEARLTQWILLIQPISAITCLLKLLFTAKGSKFIYKFLAYMYMYVLSINSRRLAIWVPHFHTRTFLVVIMCGVQWELLPQSTKNQQYDCNTISCYQLNTAVYC